MPFAWKSQPEEHHHQYAEHNTQQTSRGHHSHIMPERPARWIIAES